MDRTTQIDQAAKMSMISNQQRRVSINERELELFATKAVRAIPETENRFPTIAFVEDGEMRRLNREFRGNDRTTDVLSFRYEFESFEPASSLGDIVISADQAQRQARENELDVELEIRQLILHGILHLCGYDHETDNGEMDAKEIRLREKLKIS